MPKSVLVQTIVLLILLSSVAHAQTKPRARDLGVPFDGTPGPFNAITDVKGVEVGHTTLISGSGKLKVGEGPVRTGVTAVLPRGKNSLDPVFGAWFSLNGNGEMTGTTWLEESGFLDGPVMITNTHSVGVVRDAVIAWRLKKAPPDQDGYSWSLPVVAETADDDLNDMNGFHVKPEHAFQALDTAHGGPVEEGNVGAAMLVGVLAGEIPARGTCPVAPVVISGGGAGDQSDRKPGSKRPRRLGENLVSSDRWASKSAGCSESEL